MKKNLKYYMELSYPISIDKISEKDGGGWCAYIPLLGKNVFQGDGETVQKAIKELYKTKKQWFRIYLKSKIEIKEPLECGD